MIMKRLLLICLVLCFWGEYGYAVEKQKDIEILYNRLLEEYLSDSVDVSQEMVLGCYARYFYISE